MGRLINRAAKLCRLVPGEAEFPRENELPGSIASQNSALFYLQPAADDLSSAKSAATDLALKAKTSGNEALSNHASELAKSESIDKARDHFKMASGEATKLAEGRSGYYVMTCPMAKADWVQSTPKVSNPYRQEHAYLRSS